MASLLDAPDACKLVAGELEAVFLPRHGMLCASLRHRGDELLRRIDDLASAAAKGSSAGIPLLHPWANRLDGPRYRAAGRDVELDVHSPRLHADANGLPMHGVPWSQLVWDVSSRGRDRIAARLDWSRPELLAVFPFRHQLDLVATLQPDALTIEVTLTATADDSVPVSFGFHPYLGLSNSERKDWVLTLPAMRRLELDARGIPTGSVDAFGGFDAPLGAVAFDDGFAGLGDAPSFSLAGGGRRITVQFLEGFPFAQVFAPAGQSTVALEPMTAPTNALVSGRDLRIVAPGASFCAAFRVEVAATGA
jgi:aldose 1-epimerase